MKSPASKYKIIGNPVKKLSLTAAGQDKREPLEKLDIQGLITRGYKTLKAARYLFLKITYPADAKQYFNSLHKYITTGKEFENANPYSKGDPSRACNIAFTAAGLESLGLDKKILDTFSREFLEGMTYEDPSRSINALQERSTLLGDTGNNSPAKWHWGNKENPVDCVLMLYAQDNQGLQNLQAELYDNLSTGVAVAYTGDTFEYDIDNIREHFGFKDGMSQPLVGELRRNKSGRKSGGDNSIKSGEFILGYDNEYGSFSPSPYVDASPDSVGLPSVRNDPSKKKTSVKTALI